MLVLSRKTDQKILIHQGLIQVKVLKAHEGVVTLGFLAPDDIDIDREEIYLRKRLQAVNENTEVKAK